MIHIRKRKDKWARIDLKADTVELFNTKAEAASGIVDIVETKDWIVPTSLIIEAEGKATSVRAQRALREQREAALDHVEFWQDDGGA
jgi:hypothetical protein